MAELRVASASRVRHRKHPGLPTFRRNKHNGCAQHVSTKPDAFDDHDVAIGAVFAIHAAVDMSTSEDIRNIQDAITSRGM